MKKKHTGGNGKDQAHQYDGKNPSNPFRINNTEKWGGEYTYNQDPTMAGNR
jgi:hypothetical protein